MAITKWRSDIPSYSGLFENFFNRDVSDFLSEQKGTVPSVNVKESDSDFRLEVAAPGLSRDDFNITLDKNVLTISGEKEEKTEKEEESYKRKEFNYTSFSRSFHLPENLIDADKIEAKYLDGILNICIPKKEETKQKAEKRINIT